MRAYAVTLMLLLLGSVAGTATAADGTWFYMKTPIGRQALVKLFASILKREGEKYFLVTPVEKCGIKVDDAPFLAVELDAQDSADGRVLSFRTNVDDWVQCGPRHALRFDPYREELVRHLLTLLALDERRIDAIRYYDQWIGMMQLVLQECAETLKWHVLEDVDGSIQVCLDSGLRSE